MSLTFNENVERLWRIENLDLVKKIEQSEEKFVNKFQKINYLLGLGNSFPNFKHEYFLFIINDFSIPYHLQQIKRMKVWKINSQKTFLLKRTHHKDY